MHDDNIIIIISFVAVGRNLVFRVLWNGLEFLSCRHPVPHNSVFLAWPSSIILSSAELCF